MEVVDPGQGSSTGNSGNDDQTTHKGYTPPITIDNVKNQVALLKHLREITKLKFQAQLLGTRMKIFPQTPYVYHTIRRHINENNLEGHTFMLPEEKKLRTVVRGLPIDTDPLDIISELKSPNVNVEECYNMINRKLGAPMPLFVIICTMSENNRGLHKIPELNNVKIKIEILRKKYGPPQCDHLSKDCKKTLDEPPKCCHCDGDHPASYLQCPKNPQNKPKKEKGKLSQNQREIFEFPPPPAVNPEPIPSTSQSPQQPGTQTSPDLFIQLRDPEVVDLFQGLQDFIQIAKNHNTRSARLSALLHYVYNAIIQESTQ
ncbi:RNA-directed DNA polymerase from mobile element jockey [Trichonephila clavipes]|nr:RNA-directed DNA polymerase from mobile element jockey [Trichonephila clavipes]